MHALHVLAAVVDLEAHGEDPYEAGDAIAAQLALSMELHEACLKRLVPGGYLHGGAYFGDPFVEGTTERGRRAVATWRSLTTAPDHVLTELDLTVDTDESSEVRSRAWSQATWSQHVASPPIREHPTRDEDTTRTHPALRSQRGGRGNVRSPSGTTVEESSSQPAIGAVRERIAGVPCRQLSELVV